MRSCWFSLAQTFRECVKTRVRTRSGSDGIQQFPRNLMIRSLPLSVLTQTLKGRAKFRSTLRVERLIQSFVQSVLFWLNLFSCSRTEGYARRISLNAAINLSI